MIANNFYKIGIDVGGTFTDIILYDQKKNKLYEEKILTTSSNPHKAIIAGLSNITNSSNIKFSSNDKIDVIHGTTLFTNSLISRTEPAPALFVTKGAGDIIYTGKGNRYDPYDRLLLKPKVLVPKPLRFEIDERILIDGKIYKEIKTSEINRLINRITNLNVKSVAIVLLHSYKNDYHEKLIKKLIRGKNKNIHISLSSEICPEIGEFDRLNTTCSNAYIQPIAENYLSKLNNEIKEQNINSDIKLIWSDGGTASLKDSIANPIRLLESGPAGGALAISYLSKENKNRNAIAFDMGGTTAKICLLKNSTPFKSSSFEFGRINGNKPGSGIKIKVPSIEMLEIGSGGGSIANIDELGLIKIGPNSAGSNPGPICYDLGGSNITISDVNLLLGYLSDNTKLAGYLSLNKVKAVNQVKKVATNNSYDYEEFVKGIRKVVNENMSQAIKLHVTEMGEDPRENILYAFGGAGPLHAYDLCEKLGINSFIVPKRAGILSSLGFLTSKIGLEKNYSFLKKINNIKLSELNKFINKSIEKTYKFLKYSKIDKKEFNTEIYLEMRYEGQGFDLQIIYDNKLSLETIKDKFNDKYKGKYGVSLSYEIQITSIKIVINEKKQKIIKDDTDNKEVKSKSNKRKVWFENIDKWVDCKIVKYENLEVGKTYKGPVIIECLNTTIVVGNKGIYLKKSNGDINVNIKESESRAKKLDLTNPINLEIILARLKSIADEADNILLKTAFSSAVRDGKDYSLVISDQHGRCVGMPTECMPLFITCMPRTISIIAKYFEGKLSDGDIIMSNDPWICSGHKSDVALVSPIFNGKKITGFVGTILHVADIGGAIGDFRAWDFYEEGLMIPPIQLYKSFKLNEELIHMIESNVRLPKLVLGDLFAMVSTINSIKSSINNLNKSISNLNFESIANEYSPRMKKAFKKEIEKFPKGSFSSEIKVDGILTEKEEEKRKDIALKAKIEIKKDKIVVDYSGTDKQRERQPINVPYSYTMADTFYAIQYILFGKIPNIGTQYCPIEIILDENSILNASKPFPVYARTRTGIHISSLINNALSKEFKDNVVAGCGHNVIFRAVGVDHKNNYFAMTFMPKGGMGATGTNDGLDCTVYPTNCTMIQTEIAESRAPIMVERNIAPNTAGRGKYRGGAGQYVKITSLSSLPLQFSFRPNFVKNTAKGLNGGDNGGSAKILINGKEQKTDPVVIKKNEYVEVITAGGGGLGNYKNRDSMKKKEDKTNKIYL